MNNKNIVEFLKGFGIVLVGASVIFGLLRITEHENKKIEQANNLRRDAICPALLSISRSARDTLIVMRSENLCNKFVLDSIK